MKFKMINQKHNKSQLFPKKLNKFLKPVSLKFKNTFNKNKKTLLKNIIFMKNLIRILKRNQKFS